MRIRYFNQMFTSHYTIFGISNSLCAFCTETFGRNTYSYWQLVKCSVEILMMKRYYALDIGYVELVTSLA